LESGNRGFGFALFVQFGLETQEHAWLDQRGGEPAFDFDRGWKREDVLAAFQRERFFVLVLNLRGEFLPVWFGDGDLSRLEAENFSRDVRLPDWLEPLILGSSGSVTTEEG
jgi:hypothetical protein